MAKSKNQKKTSNQKKKKQPKAKTRMSSITSMVPLSFVKQACGITNPFCEEATVQRWPDNSFTKSVCWSVPGYTNLLTTDVNGKFSTLYLPGLRVTAPATTPTANPAAYSNLYWTGVVPPGAVARYRITSWGVRLRCISPSLTTSGSVRIRLHSPISGASLAAVDTVSTMADASDDTPLSRLRDRDYFIIPSPLGTQARLFRDYQVDNAVSAIANWENPGWQVIQVSIDGAPASTPVLEVGIYIHYEFIFLDGDSGNAFAVAPPKNNPTAQAANASLFEKAGNFFSGTMRAIDNLFESKAGQFAAAVGASYMTKSPAPLLAIPRTIRERGEYYRPVD